MDTPLSTEHPLLFKLKATFAKFFILPLLEVPVRKPLSLPRRREEGRRKSCTSRGSKGRERVVNRYCTITRRAETLHL